MAVGAGAGGGPQVNVYGSTGTLVRSFLAYDARFTGGVRVAVGDVTGDGTPDIITAPGPGGGPDVRVFDGATGNLIREFMAYDPGFTGGVSVAAADINADGKADIVTAPGAGGGPHVKIFSGANGSTFASFLAYDPNFRGGVSVAALPGVAHSQGFVTLGQVVTGPGPGGGPDVRVFSGVTQPGGTAGYTLAAEFLAYNPDFRGGVNVAAGTLANAPSNAASNIVTAPGAGLGPNVRVFDLGGHQQAAILAYPPNFTGGVTVAVTPLDGGTILTGAGPGGGPHVEEWAFPGPAAARSFLAFDPGFTGGIFVG
jgi:FG-GAP-like repeat